MNIFSLIGQSLYAAAGMFWEILWALLLGFIISGIVMVFIPRKKMAQVLGRSGPKELLYAIFWGSVSSSCSYAAASMARSIFQKGAHIIPSLAFMLASTNLVVELSAILWVMMGWQFVVGEFIGGIILVFVMAILMHLFSPIKEFENKLENHMGHDHHGHDDFVSDPRTVEGWQKVGQAFLSEWQMIWKDIALGIVVAGFLMVLVPDSFWRSLFLQNGNADNFNIIQVLENAVVGPLVSVLSFVCSVGNIPLASVLYHGGISFGGALSFIFADLIIIPLILVYRKYYGTKMALWITGIFYISMVFTGLVVNVLFHFLGWIPKHHIMPAMNEMAFFKWNYTSLLNVIFIVVAGVLVFLTRLSKKKAEHSCH